MLTPPWCAIAFKPSKCARKISLTYHYFRRESSTEQKSFVKSGCAPVWKNALVPILMNGLRIEGLSASGGSAQFRRSAQARDHRHAQQVIVAVARVGLDRPQALAERRSGRFQVL